MNFSKKEIFLKTIKNIYGIGYLTLFLAGLAFILASLINMYLDNKQSIEYKKTTAKFHGYSKETEYDPIDERYETEYTGYYTFEVNGKTYKASPKYTQGDSDFKKTLKIKYDPTNPNVYIPEGSYYQNILVGLGIWVILIICLRNGYDTEKKALEYYATHRQ